MAWYQQTWLFFPENQRFSQGKKKQKSFNYMILDSCTPQGFLGPDSLLEFLKGAMTNSDNAHKIKLR